MSALIFPTVGLTTGTQYTGDNGVTYVYDGVKWVGHGTNLSPGTSSIINNGHVVQVDTTGNLVVPGYVIPATTGTTNQVLTWPSLGNILTWTTLTAASVWQLTSGTAVVSLGADGNLTLPTGYSIGGNTNGNDGIALTTDRGTVLFGNHPEQCTPITAASHFHIMRENNSTVDLFFGDDYNYVKLPKSDNGNGVEIGTNADHVWRFDTDGILNFPNNNGQMGQLSSPYTGLEFRTGSGADWIGISYGEINDDNTSYFYFDKDGSDYLTANHRAHLQIKNPAHDGHVEWLFASDGTTQFPNNTIDAGTSSITVSSNVYSELAWHNHAINGDPYETLDSYIGVDTFGTYIVNEYTNSAGTGSNASFWYFKPSGILQIGQIGQVGTGTGIVQNVGADIVDGNGNSLIYVVSTATAPASRLNGQLWFNSVEGRAYIKYEDVWVDLSPTVIAQPSTYLDELSISGTTISQTNTTGTEAVIINNNTSSWQFGTDGKLTFPAGYVLPNTVGTAGQVLSVSTNSNVLYWTTASGGTLSSVLGVVTFPGDLLIGTLWPDGDDKESVVWAKDDTEYLGLWWGGDQIYPEEFYGPVAGIQIGAGATDDFTNTPSPTGTNITLAINGDMDTLEWVFDRDGNLTLPNGMTIDASDSVPTVTIGGPNTKIRIDDGGAPPGFYITTNATSSTAHGWLFGPDGELQFPRGSTISETTTTTVITPPGALAGQGLVIRTTTGGGLRTTDTFTPGGVVTITFYDNGSYFATGGYTSPGSESNTWTYTITGISQADLGSPLTGAFLGANWAIVNSNPVNTATFSIPALSNGTGFTITLDKIITDPPYRLMGVPLDGAGRNSLTVGSVTTSSEISHVHLTSADPATVDLYLGDDDQYVKIEKNHGNVVVGTNTATNIWTFGTDGNLTLPLETKLNSGGVGVANSAELGTSVTLSTSTVVNSEIYMGSGYGEFRSIYNKVGSTSSGLTYAGVEGFNYAQYGDVNFSGMVSQTPHIDSMYTISVSTTTGLISIGFTQDGGTSVSKDWITVLGTLNTGYTVNGIFADTTQTVIAGGNGVLSSIVKLTDSVSITTIDNITTGTQTWTFGTDGALTLPQGGVINETLGAETLTLVGAGLAVVNQTYINTSPTLYTGSNGVTIEEISPGVWFIVQGLDAKYISTDDLITWSNGTGGLPVPTSTVNTGVDTVNVTVGTETWTFGTDGGLTFPDLTVQSSAYTGMLPPVNGDGTSGNAWMTFYADNAWQSTSKVTINPASGMLTLNGTNGAGGITFPNSGVLDVGLQLGTTSGLTRNIYSEYVGGYALPLPTYGELSSSMATWTADITDIVNTIYWTGISLQTWKLTGYFRAPEAGTYTFNVSADDYYFIIIDGDVSPVPEINTPAVVVLTQGQIVSYKVLYANVAGGGTLDLQWKNNVSQPTYTSDFGGLVATNTGGTVDLTVNSNAWTFGGDGTTTLPTVPWNYVPTTFSNIQVSYGQTQLTFTVQPDGTIDNAIVTSGVGGYGPPDGTIDLIVPGNTFPGGTGDGSGIGNDITFNFALNSAGETITGTIPTYVSGTPPARYDNISSTGNMGLGSGSSHWTFGTTGTITLPQGSTIGETTTTTVISPPGAVAGQSLVIRPTAGPVNTETNHIHLLSGDPVTVDLYLGDDDQYVKIEKNHGNVVVGTNTNTNQWIFGSTGALTFPDTSTQTTAWNSSTVVRPEQIVGGLPPVVTLTGAVAGFNGAGQLNAQFTVQSNSTVTDVGVLKIGVSGSNLSGVTTATASTGSFDITIISGVDQATAVVMAYATNAAGTAYSIPLTGTSSVLCLVRGTLVALSDGTSKPVEDITYDDLILAWDFDRGGYAEARPLWIKREETTHNYNLLSFSDGSTLRTVDQHRIFNKEAGAFTYPMTDATPIGTTTYNQHGDEITLIKKERVYDTVAYYNVITDYHMNVFADSILTSCRFNNIYPIVDMKFVKDGRILRSRSEFANIPDRFYTGLRLSEQTFDLDMIEWYVERLIHMEVNAVALAI